VFRILLLLFLVIPVIEIYLLIQIGGYLGAGTTIFLVVFTAVLGAWLLRLQGFSTLRRVQKSMARGEIPAIEMLGGILLLLSGALLLTPGFFTDTIGFLMLLPTIRRGLVIWFLSRSNIIKNPFNKGNGSSSNGSNGPNGPNGPGGSVGIPPSSSGSRQPKIIEGEFKKED